MERLEDLIKGYVVRYMDPNRFGGKVFVIHGKDALEFTDLNKARSTALSMPGISIIIAVPKRDEVDEAFMRFMRLVRES
ncbi:hypothetical protein JCM16161A_13300 [Vulcanisaeta sp. JCM 16161]|uniref:hypothetical protein n=1 Tax=Vulcanisaeta sp. JCM 16161 TaxID=1295372 RepID=UPI0006D124BB|nr:hypothetical protein [Vulcanisaeta sp. JCM 16161]